MYYLPTLGKVYWQLKLHFHNITYLNISLLRDFFKQYKNSIYFISGQQERGGGTKNKKKIEN